MCSEETQKKILKPDIFRILESEGITAIGALYKVSPSKFVLVFGSKTAKEKLQGTEISYISAVLAIQKFLLISANELVLSEIGQNLFLWLSSFLSSLLTRRWDLPSPIFGEVVFVFKGKHKFNRSIRNGRKHVRMLESSDTVRKIYSHEKSRGMSFSRKRWCCATGAKLDTCLARIVLFSLALKKILTCLSLSRVVLLHRIKNLQFYQLAKPYKIDDYSGPSGSLWQCFFVELSHCWLCGEALLLKMKRWLWKFPMKLIFNPIIYQWS